MHAGLDVDEFAPRLSFFFNAHNDFFEEIGKFRAARRIWARWLKERYGAKSEQSMQLRFHTQTAGVSLTAQQPEVNIARVAIQALAGVLGGTQSLHTDAYDEALALPTEKAARIALRTQQVIAEETGAALVADPLGGSHYVEWMTDEMERQAEEIFAHLDEVGDGSILEGCFRVHRQRLVHGRDRRRVVALEKKANRGRRIVVGVNAFTDGDDGRPPILSISAEAEELQRKRLAEVKQSRDEAAVAHCARRGQRGRPKTDHKHHALDPRRGEGVRDRRRDHEHPGRRVRPLPRDGGALTDWTDTRTDETRTPTEATDSVPARRPTNTTGRADPACAATPEPHPTQMRPPAVLAAATPQFESAVP